MRAFEYFFSGLTVILIVIGCAFLAQGCEGASAKMDKQMQQVTPHGLRVYVIEVEGQRFVTIQYSHGVALWPLEKSNP